MSTPSTNLRDLFESALLLAPDERAAFLEAQCPDAAVRARVELLLQADASEHEPVSSERLDLLARAIGDASAPTLPPGSRIGPATPEERKQVMQSSALFGHYEKSVDRESAYEKLKAAAGAKLEAAGAKPAAPPRAGGGSVMDVLGGILMGSTGPRGGRRVPKDCSWRRQRGCWRWRGPRRS